MNKPTSDEIMKALEYCTKDEKYENISCKERGCPFYRRCKKDINALEKAAFNLIKSRDAKIKRLEKELSFLNKRYSDVVAAKIDVSVEEIASAQSKAVKEFGEELSNTFNPKFDYGGKYIKSKIDKFIKEKVGDK